MLCSDWFAIRWSHNCHFVLFQHFCRRVIFLLLAPLYNHSAFSSRRPALAVLPAEKNTHPTEGKQRRHNAIMHNGLAIRSSKTAACIRKHPPPTVAFVPAGVADADAAMAGGGGGAVSTGFAASAWLIGTKPAGPSFNDRSVAGASKVDSHASTVGKVTSAPPLQSGKDEL